MKTALITGATGGIGRAIADALAAEGWSLILCGRDAPKLQDLASAVMQTHPDIKAEGLPFDVARSTDVALAFDNLAARGVMLNVLVNCAGVSGGGITSDIEPAFWDNVIQINLNGAFYVTHAALHRDLIAKGGRIVNIASTGGKQGVIFGAPYSASKHGLVGFTKSLGLELARNGSGITVNAVCPGFVETEMAERVRAHYAKIWNTDAAETKRRIQDRVPVGRYIEPHEVAAMVSYLTSGGASGVTAQALNVCGGLGNY
jgi:ketoreductase